MSISKPVLYLWIGVSIAVGGCIGTLEENSEQGISREKGYQEYIKFATKGKGDVRTVRWIRKKPADIRHNGEAYYKDDKCMIVAPEPRSANDRNRMRVLGHELYHCFVGQFH